MSIVTKQNLQEETVTCTSCGNLTEWDYALEEAPKCVICWDIEAGRQTKEIFRKRKERTAQQRAYYLENKDRLKKTRQLKTLRAKTATPV